MERIEPGGFITDYTDTNPPARLVLGLSPVQTRPSERAFKRISFHALNFTGANNPASRGISERNLADAASVWQEESGVAPGGKRYTDAPLELQQARTGAWCPSVRRCQW